MASSVASEEAYVVPSADPLNAFQDPRASLPWLPNLKKYTVPAESSFLFNIGSWVTMAAITTIGRALFLFHNLEVHNIETYQRVVFERTSNRPLITVSNHQSAIDDPLLFSALTSKVGLKWPRKQRSTVGAAELCFANPLVSTICYYCKVLPVVRGEGIWQPLMEDVLGRLSAPTPDNWVHIFPEGQINQKKGELLRFKWGLGRLVADPDVTPLVLPIYIEGTKRLVCEDRVNRYLMSSWYGERVVVRVGEPIDLSELVAHAKEQALTSGKPVDRIKTYREISSIVRDRMEELRKQCEL